MPITLALVSWVINMVEYLVFFLSCFYILTLFLFRMCLQYAAPLSMTDMFHIFSTRTFCFISIACAISGVWPVDSVSLYL